MPIAAIPGSSIPNFTISDTIDDYPFDQEFKPVRNPTTLSIGTASSNLENGPEIELLRTWNRHGNVSLFACLPRATETRDRKSNLPEQRTTQDGAIKDGRLIAFADIPTGQSTTTIRERVYATRL